MSGSLTPRGIFEGLQEVDSFNEVKMILEGIDPLVKQPGVTWYVKKHYRKKVIDVDNKDEELTGTNMGIDEEEPSSSLWIRRRMNKKWQPKRLALIPIDKYPWNKIIVKLMMLMAMKLFVALSNVLRPRLNYYI